MEPPRPPETLGREAETGMVGTEMLAPPDTDDWLLLEKEEGKLEGEEKEERELSYYDASQCESETPDLSLTSAFRSFPV